MAKAENVLVRACRHIEASGGKLEFVDYDNVFGFNSFGFKTPKAVVDDLGHTTILARCAKGHNWRYNIYKPSECVVCEVANYHGGAHDTRPASYRQSKTSRVKWQDDFRSSDERNSSNECSVQSAEESTQATWLANESYTPNLARQQMRRQLLGESEKMLGIDDDLYADTDVDTGADLYNSLVDPSRGSARVGYVDDEGVYRVKKSAADVPKLKRSQPRSILGYSMDVLRRGIDGDENISEDDNSYVSSDAGEDQFESYDSNNSEEKESDELNVDDCTVAPLTSLPTNSPAIVRPKISNTADIMQMIRRL